MKTFLLRLLSAGVACAALMLLGGAKTWAVGPNLMTNPGFEEATTDQWNVATNFTATSSTAHTGSYSLQCNLSQTYQNADEYASVWPSTNYTSSVWVKGSGTFTFQIENQAWNAALASVVITATSTWTQYTLNYSTGTNTTVEIMIWDGSSGTGTVYCDDFTNGVAAATDLGFNPTNPSASGLSYVWGDEFANGNTIDASASGGNGYHWYPQQWYGYGATPAADIPVSGGALDCDGDPDNITTLNSAFPSGNSLGFQGTAFGAGGAGAVYFEARIAIADPDNTGTSKYGGGWPAFWMNSLQGDTGQNTAMAGNPGYVEWIEQDIMEINATFGTPWSYSSATHDWVSEVSPHNVYDVAEGSPMCLNANNNVNTFFAAYHTYGLLWVPATSANGWHGYRQPFFDGAPGPAQCWIGNQTYSGTLPPTFTSMGSYWNSLMDNNTFDLMVGTGMTGPQTSVDYVHVFSTTVNSVTVVQASGSSGHPPAGPTSLGATGSSGSVALTWTGGSGATSYNIYRGTSAGGEGASAIGTSSTASYTDSTVSNGTTYYYFVTGVNTYALSVPSNEAHATPSGGGGSIAFVQDNYNNPASGSSVSVAYSSSQTAGNMNIVAAGSNSPSNTVSSVTDTQGNTYSKAIGPTSGGGTMQYIYYAPSIKAGSNTVTVTYNASVTYPDVRIAEYSGVASLDTTVGASGSSASAASGNLTTTNANDLLFAATDCYPTTTAFSSGYTDRWPSGDTDGNSAADQVVSSTGSYSSTGTLSSSGYWVIQLAAFKGGSGSKTNTTTSLASSLNPSTSGQSVTFTATVSPSVPNGETVTFKDGGTTLGTGTTSSSVATYATSTLSVATHSITAVYAGDSSFNASTSSTLSQVVNAAPTIALKQDNFNNPTSGTTVTCAYSSSETAGDMNIVAVGSNTVSATISSITDSQGNTYTKAVGMTASGGTEQSIYYAPSIKAGSDTVSVTFSGSVGYPDIRVTEFSGVTGLDKTAAASGTSAAPSSGSVTTTHVTELLFTATDCYPTTNGFGAGYTDIWPTSGDTDGNSAAYEKVTSTGSYSGTATLNSSNYWVIQLITLY